VNLATAEGVATITLSAPWRSNALDPAMLTRLAELVEGLADDVRVVLLRGDGERSFTTGYYLPALVEELDQGPSVNDYRNHPMERALRAIEGCPVPTVAVVQGHAYGAGCEVALACDMRVGAEEARLCMPPAKLGILYSATGLRRLLELVGPSLAKELIYTADVVEAPRALALGLLNRVVPKPALESTAAELAAQIAANDALSIRYTKRIFAEVLGPGPFDEDTLDEVARWRAECFQRPELKARVERLLDRKRPGT
jgi:enoyl-CoA hydratase/carnithine racemase